MAGGGFKQCYNAQAVVVDSLLVVAIDLEQAAKEKQQLEPMLADSGYFSATNVTTYEAANIVPLIATRREVHHPS